MSEQDQPVVDPFAVPETTDAASAEAETSDAAPDADAIASEFVADEVTADDVLIDEAQAEAEADVVAEAQEIVARLPLSTPVLSTRMLRRRTTMTKLIPLRRSVANCESPLAIGTSFTRTRVMRTR